MLTDIKIKNAKATGKMYRITDEKRMFLEVSPKGGKSFRMRYDIYGKRDIELTLGSYPELSLADARKLRDEYRSMVETGIDPKEHKKQEKLRMTIASGNTFRNIALEYNEKKKGEITETERKKQLRRLELHVLPKIGDLPINSIDTPILLAIAKQIQGNGLIPLAHRVMQECGLVFRYAIASGYCKTDPTYGLKGALKKYDQTHMAAFIEPHEVAEMMRKFYSYDKGTIIVQYALKLAPLLFCRIGELRTAKWCDIDLNACEWRYFVGKVKKDHIVPLSKQAVQLLTELKQYTGNFEYVFAGARDVSRCMSDGAINKAIQRMGYSTQTDITGHGFRAMARTMLAERLSVQPEVIEHQLSHKVPDKLGTAYNRTKYLDERRRVMQVWADYLDMLRLDANVLPFVKSS